jgi:WD40 repeat protein
VGTLADVYALGAILYFLLTDQPPFGTGDYVSVLVRVASEEPVAPRRLRPLVHRDVETICLKCLEKDPARRYASAQELADELGRYLDGFSIHARPTGTAERAWKWARRRPTTAALVAVCTAALTSLLLGSLWYNVRLDHLANKLQKKNEQLDQKNELLDEQVKVLRRGVYAGQLCQVQILARDDPGQALRLLDEPERCPPDLRDFTWSLWRYRSDHLVHRLEHRAPVLAVAYSPDHKLLASCSADGAIKLWDLETGRERQALEGRPRAVRSVLFLPPDRPDGLSFATAGDEGDVHLWALSSLRPMRSLKGTGGPLLCLAVTADGHRLGASAKSGSVTVWDLDRDEPAAHWSAHKTPARSLAFSPDGKELATGGDDGLRLWDLTTGVPPKSALVATNWTVSLTYSSDHRYLAAGRTSASPVAVYTRAPRRELRRFPGVFPTTHSVAFFPDDRRLLAGSTEDIGLVGLRESTLSVWNVESGKREIVLRQSPFAAAALAPGGATIATAGADHNVRVWRLGGPAPTALDSLLANCERALFAPDGRIFLVCPQAQQKHRILVWNCGRQRVTDSFEQVGNFLEMSPDGRVLGFGARGKLHLYDTATGTVRTLTDDGLKEAWVTALAFAPGGERFAYVVGNSTVVLTTSDGASVRFPSPERAVQSMAFSPDGQLLAIGSWNGPVVLCDARTGEVRKSLPGHTDHVNCVLFDGNSLLISGSRDGSVKLWDLATSHERATITGFRQWVNALALSPDGRTLAAASGYSFRYDEHEWGELMLCDPVTGQVRSTFREYSAPLAFAPDGRSLLVGKKKGMSELRAVAP